MSQVIQGFKVTRADECWFRNFPINPNSWPMRHDWSMLMNIFPGWPQLPHHPLPSLCVQIPPWPSAHRISWKHLHVSGHDVGSQKNANASPIRPWSPCLFGLHGGSWKQCHSCLGRWAPSRSLWMELFFAPYELAGNGRLEFFFTVFGPTVLWESKMFGGFSRLKKMPI